MKNILIIAFCFIGFTIAEAQVKVAQPSPKSIIKQVVGIDSVEIVYSRPSMRNREIFGNLVPYNQLWRTGANENTTITFYNSFNFGGVAVQAGKYALYTIPKKDVWEVILYDKADNWGAPKALEDKHIVSRCFIKPKPIESTVETFTINFSDFTDSSAILALSWENTMVEIPMAVNTIESIMKNIEETMGINPDYSDYIRASEFYIKNNQNKDLALEWAHKAVDLKPDSFYAYMVLSKAYAYFTDYTNAIINAKKSKALAEKAGNLNYVEENEKNIAYWSQEM
ncbi:MAG: DUF2911 domain-containing protein [Weeksellaceae bacterium]